MTPLKFVKKLAMALIGVAALQVNVSQADGPGNPDAVSIASKARQINQSDPEKAFDYFFTCLADKVVLHHEPASKVEGAVDGSYISGGLKRENMLAHKAMKDFRIGLSDIVVHGNIVEVVRTWSGTMPDGEPFLSKTRVEFEVRNSQIVAVTAQSQNDEATRQKLSQMMHAKD
jgi:hypothetical protein